MDASTEAKKRLDTVIASGLASGALGPPVVVAARKLISHLNVTD